MMNILLIDDNKADIDQLTNIIQHSNHHPIVSKCTADAIKTLREDKYLPEIIMISNHLSNDDPYQAAAQFKEIINNSHVAIFFLSNTQKEDILQHCLEVGSDYILKPIIATEVIEKISLHQKLKQQTIAHRKTQITSNNEYRSVNKIKKVTTDNTKEENITVTELTFDTPAIQADITEATSISDIKHLLPWQLTMNLKPEDMRKAEPVPQIFKLFNGAVGLSQHQGCISTIISELYNNALEHGLLRLDSTIKATDNGFFEYYELRAKRLNALTDGFINIDINFRIDYLTITLKDSSAGFDFSNRRNIQNHQIEDTFGRGINIIDQLCESIEYSECGSKITATYCISH